MSCRCHRCGAITASRYATYTCPGCELPVVTPINATLTLCPVCATLTEIPERYLNLPLDEDESPNLVSDLETEEAIYSQAVYVSYEVPKNLRYKSRGGPQQAAPSSALGEASGGQELSMLSLSQAPDRPVAGADRRAVGRRNTGTMAVRPTAPRSKVLLVGKRIC